MNLRNIFAMALMVLMVGCGGSKAKTEPLDPGKANAAAQTYVSTLYADKGVKGPVCMPEAVVDGYTQCSFTYDETGTTSETPTGDTVTTTTTKVATVLCNNNGCMEGDAPTMMSADIAPETYASNGGHDSITDDWLFWYMLYSSGGTTHHYHGWYDSTPHYGRTAYYSKTYTPTAKSTSYYKSSYSSTVKKSSTSKYSSKTSPKKKATTKKTSTSKKTTTSKTKSNSTTTTKKKTTTKKSNRSSGYGTKKRSSGSRSRSRRR